MTDKIHSRLELLSSIDRINEEAITMYCHGRYDSCLRKWSFALSLLIEALQEDYSSVTTCCDTTTTSRFSAAKNVEVAGCTGESPLQAPCLTLETTCFGMTSQKSGDDAALIIGLFGPMSLKKASATTISQTTQSNQLTFAETWERLLHVTVLFNLYLANYALGKVGTSEQLLDLCLDVALEAFSTLTISSSTTVSEHQPWGTNTFFQLMIKIYFMKARSSSMAVTQDEQNDRLSVYGDEEFSDEVSYLHGAYDLSVQHMGCNHICTNYLRQALFEVFFKHGHFAQAAELMEQHSREVAQAAASILLDDQKQSIAPAA